MELTFSDKVNLIKKQLLNNNCKDPLIIAREIMHNDYVSMHGPEHHFIDGASFLTAYKNCNGDINLENALDLLAQRAAKIPGAMCGYWGVCGSSASLGAALAIIHQTGPLTDNDFYKDNMELSSNIIKSQGQIGGPRCCKRNCYIALIHAIKFVNNKYGIEMPCSEIHCDFSSFNKTCLSEKCPFHK